MLALSRLQVGSVTEGWTEGAGERDGLFLIAPAFSEGMGEEDGGGREKGE